MIRVRTLITRIEKDGVEKRVNLTIPRIQGILDNNLSGYVSDNIKVKSIYMCFSVAGREKEIEIDEDITLPCSLIYGNQNISLKRVKDVFENIYDYVDNEKEKIDIIDTIIKVITE